MDLRQDSAVTQVDGSWGLELAACAATVLLMAYVRPSISGAVFLLAWLAWGAVCLPAPNPARCYRRNQAVWLAVAALAGAYVCAQLAVQVLYSSGRIPEREQVQELLIAFGFPPMESLSTAQVVLMWCGPLLCLAAASAMARKAHRALAALASPPLHTISSQPSSSRQQPAPAAAAAAPGLPVPFMMGLMHSNAGIFVAALLLACALLWPSLLSVPYLLAVCWALWRWARAQPCWVLSPWVRLLQLYAGAQLLLLYLWQVPLLRLQQLQQPAQILGLYALWRGGCEGSDDDSSCRGALAPQVAHFVCLHLLFVVLGAYLALTQQPLYKRLQREAAQRQREGGGRWWLLSTETAGYEPLLSAASAESPVAGSPRLWSDTVLGGTAAGLYNAPVQQAEGQGPGSSSGANGTNWQPIEAFITESPQAMRQVLRQAAAEQPGQAGADSPAGMAADAGQLRDGQPPSSTQQPHQHGTLPSLGRWQQGKLLLQLLLPFVVSSLEYGLEVLLASPSVAAIAMVAFSMVQVSVVGCATLLLGLFALLAPSRYGKVVLQRCSPYLTALYMLWLLDNYAATALWHVVRPPELLTSIGIWGYGQPPPALLPLLLQLLVILVLAGLSRAHSCSSARGPPPARELRQLFGAKDRLGGAASPAGWPSPFHEDAAADQARRWWHSLSIAGMQLLWYTLHLAVPLSWFLLGVASLDILHAVYLLATLLYFLWVDLQLAPPPPKAPAAGSRLSALPAARYQRHWAMRLYGSLHLVAIYLALVLLLPGLRTELSERVLEFVGLLDASRLQDIVSVMLVLLLATLHVGLGKWLASQPAPGTDNGLPNGQEGAGADIPNHSLGAAGGNESARAVDCVRGAVAALAWLAKVHSPLLWRLVRWVGRAAVSGGLAMLVLLGYILVLYDTPISLVGATYLLLLLLVFLFPPSQDAYLKMLDGLAVCGPRSQGSRRTLQAAIHSLRWLLLVLLALFCAAELLSQYVLVLANLGLQHPLLPAELAVWLREVVGIDDAVEGKALALALARPVALLAAQYVFRWLYSVGMLEMWRREHLLSQEQLMARRLAKQNTLAWLMRRFLILHSGKLVLLLCFVAAMQHPSANGLMLVAALALLSVMMSGVGASVHARRAQAVAARALEVMVSLWILLDYVYQVTWLREQLLPTDDRGLAALLEWLGIPLVQPDGAAALEPLLRWKVLLLVAVSIKRQADRWEAKLPPEVRAAAQRGDACTLFWPPPWEDRGADSADSMSTSMRFGAEHLLLPIKALLLKVLRRVMRSANKILRAMDLSEHEAPLRRHPHPVMVSLQRVKGALSRPASWPRDLATARQPQQVRPRRVRLAAAISSLQCFLERFWDNWGMEVCMLALLLAAFVSCSALGLLYMALVGLGMVTKGRVRCWLWKRLVVPLLAVLLVLEYAVYVGPPPNVLSELGALPLAAAAEQGMLDAAGAEPSPGVLAVGSAGIVRSLLQAATAWTPGSSVAAEPAAPPAAGGDQPPEEPASALLLRWLGLADVQPSSLWALFAAFAFCALQVHRDACGSASSNEERLGTRRGARGSAGVTELKEPLLGSYRDRSWEEAGGAGGSGGSGGQEIEVVCSQPAGGEGEAEMHVVVGRIRAPTEPQSAPAAAAQTTQQQVVDDPFAAAEVQAAGGGLGHQASAGASATQPAATGGWPPALQQQKDQQQQTDIEMAKALALQPQEWQQEAEGSGYWQTRASDTSTQSAPVGSSRAADMHAGTSYDGTTGTAASTVAGPAGRSSLHNAGPAQRPPHQQQQQQRAARFGGRGDRGSAGGGSEAGDGGGAPLFQPMRSSEQGRWSWLDWARYQLVKHSMDVVLVCLVAVCTYQKDVVHAGYLAIALLFFRQHSQLMVPGNRLFPWLPAFNFLVMFFMVAYQAPLELLLGQQWANSCELGANPHCTVPTLLGFCKLCQWRPGTGGSMCATLLFRHSGALADFLLWVLLRLQTRLFASDMFAKAMAVAAEERAAAAACRQRHQRAWYNAQARRALHTSRLRVSRTLRIAQLKESLYLAEDDIYGIQVPPAYLDASMYPSSPDRSPDRRGPRAGGAGADWDAGSGVNGGAGGVDGWGRHGREGRHSIVELLNAGQGSEEEPADLQRGLSESAGSISGDAAGGSGQYRQYSMGFSRVGSQAMAGGQSQAVTRGSGQGQPSPLGRLSTLPQHQRRSSTGDTIGGNSSIGDTPGGNGSTGDAAAGLPPRYGGPALPRGLPRAPGSGSFNAGGAVAAIAVEVARASLGHRRSVSDPSHFESASSGPDGAAETPADTPQQGRQAQEGQPQGPEKQQQQQRIAPGSKADAARPHHHHRHHHHARRVGWLQWAWNMLQRLLQDSSWEPWLCYALFILAFVMDMSVMTLVYPLSMVLVPLLAKDTVRSYWRAMLVYTEAVLILQYTYEVVAHCLCLAGGGRVHPGGGTGPDAGGGCVWILGDANALRRLDALGLHASAMRTLPLFLVYLATLMHNYALASTTTPPLSSDLEDRTSLPHRRRSHAVHHSLRDLMQRVQSWLLWVAFEVSEHFSYVALPHERPPSWLKVDLGPPRPGHPAWNSQEGRAALQEAFQAGLDELRERDTSARAARSGKDGRGDRNGNGEEGVAEDGAGSHDDAGGGISQPAGAEGTSVDALRRQQQLQQQRQGAGSRAEAAGGSGGAGSGGDHAGRQQRRQEAAAGGPAARAFQEVLEKPQDPEHCAKCLEDVDEAEEGVPFGLIDLSTITRLVLRLDRVVDGDVALLPRGSASVLFEVLTEPPVKGSEGMGRLPPRRSARPAHDAALAVLRLMHERPATKLYGGDAGPGDEGRPPQGEAKQQERQQEQELQGRPDAQVQHDQGPSWQEQEQQRLEPQPPQQPQKNGSQHRQGTEQQERQQEGAEEASKGVAGLEEIQPASSIGGSAGNVNAALDASAASEAGAAAGTSGDGAGHHGAPPPDSSSKPGYAASLSDLPILSVEFHSRPPHDYYFATAFVDFLSFLYVALFYQVVMLGVRSLADITDERVLPWDYLSALILVFLVMVGDRVFYALGSHLGKFALFLLQLALFIPTTMRLFWSPASGHTAHTHLRIFMLLKCISFALNALQLRSGFPPRASFDGGGRQRFFFYARADTLHQIGLAIFMAIPFMYELRTLLDWTCSATTLTWYNWLKLEDIRQSLYTEECKNVSRSGRKVGDKVPRFTKFLQGTLLFCLLLLAIWLPLLLFSSGAPTYQIPGVADARVNVSMGVVSSFGDYQGVMRFPLFEAGDRRSVQNYLASNASLPAALSGYTADQIKLLCLSQDSDSLWRIPPPAQRSLEAVLSEPSAAISIGWAVTRTAPLASPKGGGPLCVTEAPVRLAGETRVQLLEVLRGQRRSTALMALNTSDPDGWRPGHMGPRGLYPLMWRLRSEQCVVRMGFDLDARAKGASGDADGWSRLYVGCNASLELVDGSGHQWWRFSCEAVAEDAGGDDDAGSSDDGGGDGGEDPLAGSNVADLPVAVPASRTGFSGSSTDTQPLSDVAGRSRSLQVGSSGKAGGSNADGELPGHAECGESVRGPFVVAVLERVQSGLLGATLSSMGITGLYISFVYGISRFLRLSFTNIRLKIPYEDFPSTRRLVALVQDIYIARAECELALEEELYWLLIRIFKTPRLLQELTRKEHAD